MLLFCCTSATAYSRLQKLTYKQCTTHYSALLLLPARIGSKIGERTARLSIVQVSTTRSVERQNPQIRPSCYVHRLRSHRLVTQMAAVLDYCGLRTRIWINKYLTHAQHFGLGIKWPQASLTREFLSAWRCSSSNYIVPRSCVNRRP